MSSLSRLLISTVVLGALSGSGVRAAHAESPTPPSGKPVVAVDVAADDPLLDPASVRAAIGVELGEEAVAPEDARGAQPVGTIRVSIDRKAHALVVAYRGESGPITRSVELPADRATTERAAVLLAGNLARDEAGELAKSLPKSVPRSEPTADASPPPPPSAPPSPAPAPEDIDTARELDLLGRTLEVHARESHPRQVASQALLWTGMGGLFASSGLVIASVAKRDESMGTAGQYVFAGGVAVIAASDLLRPGNFSGLYERYVSGRQDIDPRQARADLEGAWAAEARREHHRRFVSGLAFTILGGASVALGACSASLSGNTAQIGPAIASSAVGAEITTFGIYWLATNGPVESGLRAYERSSGHFVPARAEARLLLRPFLAPTRGGGMAGLGGEF